jgi:ubiquinone/menaquinone biosynthesis C-methylase UbiE
MEREAYEELYCLEPDHWWYRGMRRITDQILTRIPVGQKRWRILDAGCGVGGNLTAFSPLGQTFGVDYSRLALTYANETHPGKLSQATVEALPYADHSFDLVTSFDVLCCREVEDDSRALAELARVLHPGGYVLVRVPAFTMLRGPHDLVVHGVRRYTAAELRRKMVRVGLTPVRLTYLNSFLMPLIFLFRQIQNIRVSWGAVPRSDVRATPRLINDLLLNILKLEASWIGQGHHFFAGVSVLCLALKPESSGV